MLLLSLIIVAAFVIAWFVIKDMNKPLAEKISTTAHKVEDKVEAVVEKVADLNKDGKVNLADAKIVAKKTKQVADKTVEQVKKARGRKKKSQ
jgi:hypothetical protein